MSFLDNLRATMGGKISPYTEFGEKALYGKITPPSRGSTREQIEELYKRDAEKNISDSNKRNAAAYRGTLFVEPKQELEQGALFDTDMVSPVASKDVAYVSTKLDDVLRKYVSAKDWDDRKKVSEKYRKEIAQDNRALNFWFDQLDSMTSAVVDEGYNNTPEKIANQMHLINIMSNKIFNNPERGLV